MKTHVGSVLSAMITYGIRKQPIPPIPAITLRMPKKTVDVRNKGIRVVKGEITPAPPTSNIEIKKADLRPQQSAISPNMNAPNSIPSIYNALKMPFR